MSARARNIAVAVLALAAAALPARAQIGADRAPYQNAASSFRIEFCNKSPWQLFVALNYGESEKWTTEGWWKVEKDKCLFVKTVSNRYFYYFAENEDRKRTWGNGGKGRCVVRPGPFKMEQYSGSCRSGHDFADFKEMHYTKDLGGTYTIDLLE